jgi:hypothetical protein
MKSKTVFLACVVLIGTGVAFGKYSGGTGEPNDPYRIATAEDLNDIGNHVEDFNKCFVMVNDINLAEYTGTEFSIIGTSSSPFTGVFDGNGWTISNFTYLTAGANYVGLFGNVSGAGAEVRNLELADPNVDAGNGYYVGALVGRNNGRVRSCSVMGGSVAGRHTIGGLVGSSRSGSIVNCRTALLAHGEDWVGGLAGDAWGVVSHSFATGDVFGGNTVIEVPGVGGLVG